MLSAVCSAKSTMSSRAVAVDRVERGALAVAALQAVDDVVRDAVALVLAEQQIPRQIGPFGIIDEQVAQQERGALDVASALLEQVEYLGIRAGSMQQRHRGPP
jgi:hypothetical protein